MPEFAITLPQGIENNSILEGGTTLSTTPEESPKKSLAALIQETKSLIHILYSMEDVSAATASGYRFQLRTILKDKIPDQEKYKRIESIFNTASYYLRIILKGKNRTER